MRSLAERLAEYGESHQHPVNIAIHKVAIPSIIFSLLAMLSKVPVLPMGINGAMALIATVLPYYMTLSLRFAMGMGAVTGSMLLAAHALDLYSPIPLFKLSLGIFSAAWTAQFIGHSSLFENQKPAFFDDLKMLIIGPLWTLNFYYNKMGIGIDLTPKKTITGESEKELKEIDKISVITKVEKKPEVTLNSRSAIIYSKHIYDTNIVVANDFVVADPESPEPNSNKLKFD